MEKLTNEQYRQRNYQTKVAPGIYSYLSKDEIKELTHAHRCAYPQDSASEIERKVSSMACRPTQAAIFVDRVNASIKAMEAR